LGDGEGRSEESGSGVVREEGGGRIEKTKSVTGVEVRENEDEVGIGGCGSFVTEHWGAPG
jgi:hypothetical protein